MSADVRQQEFRREMQELRQRQARRLEPAEFARLARQAGLTRQEALLELRSHDGHRYMPSSEMGDVLPMFISSLCRNSKAAHVLEYVCTTSLLTAYVFEPSNAQLLTVMTPDTAVAEAMRVLGEGTSLVVVEGIAESPGVEYEVIVCQPALGHRPAGDRVADGFGGEVVRRLVPRLAAEGTLYWVTGRGVLWTPRAKETFGALQADGFNTVATLDVAPGAFSGTMIEGAIVALRRGVAPKRFVGALRDLETAEPMASAFLAGPTRKSGTSWTWLDAGDSRTFADVEQARVLQRLTPRGRHAMMSLGSLLTSQHVVRADRPATDDSQTAAAFLFVPEYAGSRVTADLADQTVKPKAVYRLAIDTSKVNPRFLAQLLNGPYGRHIRESAAHGVTIQRTSVASLLSLQLPIPDMVTQDRIARIDADTGLMRAAFRDMQSALDQDWTALPEVAEKIDKLKGILDIERQIADWWRELPYPLATIYRRYQVSTDPRERFETLLHFFEITAVYLAAVGASHVRIMRADWQEELGKWLHPPGAAGIERADFGFWIGLAAASLKDTNRIGSDKDLRAIATELVGPELVQTTITIGSLGKATEVLEVARRYRNSWKGHGGHMKASDAARLGGELQQSVRDLYEITASLFRRLQLVRPGLAEVTDTGLKFQIERLSGSDPTFEKMQVELDRSARTNALAFWVTGARTMCRALPFFRLGAPQQPQETSCYVFNRVETGGYRWISYQEAREQEFVAPDDELLGLIALGKRTE